LLPPEVIETLSEVAAWPWSTVCVVGDIVIPEIVGYTVIVRPAEHGEVTPRESVTVYEYVVVDDGLGV
jgi:hypothetical protein